MTAYLESGMDFSPLFNHSDYESFYIEKSADYDCLKTSGVKSVEFLSKRKDTLCFIEAKTTFANLNKAENLEKIQSDFQELYDKFCHSFLLFVSKELKISSTSTDFSFLNRSILETHKLKFYLVIKESKEEWCDDIKLKLEREIFMPLRKLLNLEVRVINGETARKFKIIT